MFEIALILAAAIVAASGGTCLLCKMFVDEKEVERGYVADEEHDSEGNPLTGWKLQAVRIAEMIFNPVCAPINRWLGRD